MRTLNLGILAHVDAGKTSLTERLLFAAGVIDEIGKVDSGNTQTDTLDLERQRGITIKAAVVSFVIGGVTVNLVDTPGHPDFIAEVERILAVLDGAVLVVSSVEGIQPQTRILMRALQRLRVPTLIFVNKIDRRGARCAAVLDKIRARLSRRAIALGSVSGAGTEAAAFHPHDVGDEAFRTALLELLTEADDALLEDYVGNPARLTRARLERAFAHQVKQCLACPVLFGSAVSGAGIEALNGAIRHWLPAREPDADAPLSATVFKVERAPRGDSLAYAALASGRIRIRDRVAMPRGDARVTGIRLFDAGGLEPVRSVGAGRIATLSGLHDVRIGDTIGLAPANPPIWHFAPPTLETRVLPVDESETSALWLALTQMAEQDPLINLRKSDEGLQIFVSLYGEVQKQVIQHMLLSDFGIEARLRESTVICVERPIGTGKALEVIFREPNPYNATVGLRVEPRPADAGSGFALEVDLGQMPAGFYRAVEEAVDETLRQGIFGWQVVDCHVAITQLRHSAPISTAGDFRELTPLVLAAALRRAGTVVCEPIHRFELELPVGAIGMVQPVLAQAGAVVHTSQAEGDPARLEGEIAAARIHRVQQELPGVTGGEGFMDCAFDHYRPVSGNPPTRPRSGPDPFDRREYLHRVRHKLAVKQEPRE